MRRREDLPPNADRKTDLARLLLVLAAAVAVTALLSDDGSRGTRGVIAGVLFLGSCIMFAGSSNDR